MSALRDIRPRINWELTAWINLVACIVAIAILTPVLMMTIYTLVAVIILLADLARTRGT